MVQSLKDEFTQRIADAERKAQLACKERDIAKKVIIVLIWCFPHFLLLNHIRSIYLLQWVLTHCK